jgi:hypothetical protein
LTAFRLPKIVADSSGDIDIEHNVSGGNKVLGASPKFYFLFESNQIRFSSDVLF